MKRNCKEYMDSLKGKKKEHTNASGSCIYTIEICSISSKTLWVLDTGCGYHLCKDMMALRKSKKVSRGQYEFLGAFGHQQSPTLIGDYHLSLPSGLVLILNNCCYLSSLTKNIISVDALF